MPEAAYDARRPNVSLRDLGSPIQTIWRLYRLESASADRTISAPTGPIGILSKAQAGIRKARELLQRLPVPGALEGRRLVKELRSPLLLQDLSMLPEVRSSFRYVRDGLPGENFYIDMPFRNARGITRVRLSGRTFRGPITVNGVKVDGSAALNEFQKLIEDYLHPQIGTPADYRLYWINLDAPVSAEDPFGASEWWVHPPRHGVRTQRTSQRPNQWTFSLELLALKSNRDIARAEDGFLSGLFGIGALKDLFDSLGLGLIFDAVTQIFGIIEEVKGLIDDAIAVVTAVTDFITGVTQFIKTSIAKVRGVFNGITELINRIESGIEQILDIPNLLKDQADLVRQSFPGLAGDTSLGVTTADDLRRVRDAMALVLAQPQSFGELVDGAPLLPQSISFRIRPDVTLEQLAHEADVAPEMLIDANALTYPFIDPRERPESRISRLETEKADFEARDLARIEAGLQPQYTAAIAAIDDDIAATEIEAVDNPVVPGVLYAGDPIRIPLERAELVPSVFGIGGTSLNLIAASSGAPVTEEDRLFGIDLYLSSRGDLEWDPDRMDLCLSRGLDNIRAALSRYMQLPVGALRFAPEIGNFAQEDLSKWQTRAESRLLALTLTQTLSQDPRIRKIRNVEASTLAGKAILAFEADLIDGRQLPDLRVPLPS